MKKKLLLIAGPCLVESKTMLQQTAETLLKNVENKNIELIFKSSYRKANRTSEGSFEGIGDEKAIKYLNDIKEEFNLPILTDVHSVNEIDSIKDVVDVIQIPAFLSRQTDLIYASAKTGKIVNIKKGQFMAPEDILKAAAKSEAKGAKETWLTERGTSFGYHDLVVDYRSLIKLSSSGFKAIYDATHSVQQPSKGVQSGGNPEFIESLALAAVSVGVDGVFFETHPNPKEAKSDSATQLPLSKSKEFINKIENMFNFINEEL